MAFLKYGPNSFNSFSIGDFIIFKVEAFVIATKGKNLVLSTDKKDINFQMCQSLNRIEVYY